MAEKKDQTVDENAELRAQLAALAKQVETLTKAQTVSGGITAEQLEAVMGRLMQAQAEAQLQAAREAAEHEQRENLRYPKISVFSYPEGDKANPRPEFKCQIFDNGYDLDWDTTTAEEIELLNRLEPGEYTFNRIGGGVEALTVTGERRADGRLSKLYMSFAHKEQRDTLPSLLWRLRDALGVKSAEQVEIERLKAEIAKLRPAQAVA